MHDNKVRLSRDVLEKAEVIAKEWGLKNARAAVEAVFRRYSDEYLQGNQGASSGNAASGFYLAREQRSHPSPPARSSKPATLECEALDALDDVLAL